MADAVPLLKLLSLCEDATSQIFNSLDDTTPLPQDQAAPSCVRLCGAPIASLLRQQARAVLALSQNKTCGLEASRETEVRFVKKRLGDLIRIMEDKFYAFPFSEVGGFWRQGFVDSRILEVYLAVLNGVRVGERGKEGREMQWVGGDELVDGIVGLLDSALIVAGGGVVKGRGRELLHSLLGALEDVWETSCGRTSRQDMDMDMEEDEDSDGDMDPDPDKKTSSQWHDSPRFSTKIDFKPPVQRPIPRITSQAFTLDHFEEYLSSKSATPLIFTDLTTSWPARRSRPWNRPTYLLSRTFGGRRRVPVELGRSYVDDGWGQKIIPFGQFLSKFVDPSLSSEYKDWGPKKAYLAQHELFSQIPSLRNDIRVPDYCWTSTPLAGTGLPSLNAWFGPANTITPLHTDSSYNLLAQIVGAKYIRLYAPSQGTALRPRGQEAGINMSNTSSVDLGVEMGWDEAPEGYGLEDGERALFEGAEYVDCVLGEGDTLFIPAGWWHYVRSLNVSFSVSFWWT